MENRTEIRKGGAQGNRKSHLPALTGLRFFLAIWVVVHHLTGRGMMLDAWVHSLPQAVQSLVRGGYLAVGTFFVLSGFVLARSYSAIPWSRKNLVRYGAGRVARIYPVYLLSLVFVAPFIIREKLPFFGAKGALLVNHFLLLQGWTGTLPVNWNTPAWSLSCELFFYLCFPLAAVFIYRLGGFGALALAVATCLIPGALRQLGVPEIWKPVLHLSDFLMGILTARAFDYLLDFRKGLAGRGYWLYWPAIAISLALIAYPEVLHNSISLNSALRPLNALLLLGLALEGGAAVRGMSSPVSVYLGKASYSLYILHIPLLWWYKSLVFRYYGIVPGSVLAFIFVVGVVAVSAAVFRVFEEPANLYVRDRLSGRPARLCSPLLDDLVYCANRLRSNPEIGVGTTAR